MVMIARRHDQLAIAAQYASYVLEERACREERLVRRPVTQLQHVAEQDQTIDVLQLLQQSRAQLGSAQQIDAGQPAKVQVGDDQRARHRVVSAQDALPEAMTSRTGLGSMKRTSSRITSTSETSRTPRARK